MLGFVARRLLTSFVVVAVASVAVFAMVASLGDPLAELRTRNPPPPASVVEARRQQLDLDKPVVERYALWVGRVVRGDLGRDNAGREVAPILWQRLQLTLRMVVVAMALALALAVAVGVYGAVRQYSLGDHAATFAGFLFLSMPVFWLAALLKEYGAIRVNRLFDARLVSTVGAQSADLDGAFWQRVGDYASHLALPALALALVTFAAWSRYQRAAMLDVLHADYVRMAHAKGLAPRRVLFRHALPNALIPLTTVVAVDVGAVLGGAVITERVFGWNGMGSLLVQGIQQYDTHVVMAWLMVTSVFVVLCNLAADVLYGVLDPRIRHG